MDRAHGRERTERQSIHVEDAGMVQNPRVSVLMWAYNDRPHIEQAIESVLAQQMDFSWELVVSDDCSTDGTKEILRRYQARHPRNIRLILSRVNLWKEGRITERLLRQARGKYVALHHGDDYWIDPRKLQMQVECLENDARLAFAYHNVEYVFEGEGGKKVLAFPADGGEGVLPLPPAETNFHDLLKGRVIPTLSVVYRSAFFGEVPEWLTGLPVGDWPLFLLLSSRGPGRYLDRVMGVYRQHAGGVWSSLGNDQMTRGYVKTARAVARNMPMSPEERRELLHGVWIRVLHCAEERIRMERPGGALGVLGEYTKCFPAPALATFYCYKLWGNALRDWMMGKIRGRAPSGGRGGHGVPQVW